MKVARGLTALLLTAELPDLVRAVVVVDAGRGEDEDVRSARAVGSVLEDFLESVYT